MKNLKFTLTAVLLMTVFCVIIFYGNTNHISVPVVTVPGSPAEKLAKENHWELISLPDSLDGKTDRHYESFSYNEAGNSLIIEKYHGTSKELIIPESINGKTVTAIDAGFFEGISATKLVLPDTIEDIGIEKAPSDITIVLRHDHPLVKKLNQNADSDNMWNIEFFYDSDAPDFELGDNPYVYSNCQDGIILEGYTATDDVLVIPSMIDGVPVKEIGFDLIGYTMVIIPASVERVTGLTSKSIYSRVFAVEFLFTVLSFLLTLIVLNINTLRMGRKEEYALSGVQVVLTIIYFFTQMVFAFIEIRKHFISWYYALLISMVFLTVYIILLLMTQSGRHYALSATTIRENKSQFIDEIRQSIHGISDEKLNDEEKKAIRRIEEELRYSPRSSHNDISEENSILQKEIDSLSKAAASDDHDRILISCESVMRALKKRNISVK